MTAIIKFKMIFASENGKYCFLRCTDPFQCGHEAGVSVREKSWRNIVVFGGMV